MASYMHGSLAVEERAHPEPRRQTRKRKVIRKKTMPVGEKLIYLVTIAACVAVAGCILWRYAMIYDTNMQIQHVQQEIKTYQAHNVDLQQKVRKLEDPKRLKDEAAKLGLVPAESQQITVITPAPEKKLAQNR